jgi:hypothetical protein
MQGKGIPRRIEAYPRREHSGASGGNGLRIEAAVLAPRDYSPTSSDRWMTH